MTENFGDLKTLENKYNVSYQYDQYKRAYIIYLIQHGKRSGPVRIVDVHRMEREQALAKLEAATKDHCMKYDHGVGGFKDIRISKDRLDLIEDAFGCSLTLFEDKMQYLITLLADPNYKMTIDYDMIMRLRGPDEVFAVMSNHCKSLVNKRNSDMKNYGDYKMTGYEKEQEKATREVTFIGGPHDGKTSTVNAGLRYFLAPIIESVKMSYLGRPHDITAYSSMEDTCSTFEYRIEPLQERGQYYYFGIPKDAAGIADAIRRREEYSKHPMDEDTKESKWIQLGEMAPEFEASDEAKQLLVNGDIKDDDDHEQWKSGKYYSAEEGWITYERYQELLKEQGKLTGERKSAEIFTASGTIDMSGIRKTGDRIHQTNTETGEQWTTQVSGPKCSACNDTGIVDSYMYGQYECTACSNKTEEKKPEKEMSAWDKKLKEELDNGDDTWGSIVKKYKK